MKAVKHFRPCLYGQKFRLRTDHASLRWLCRRREPSNQVARWLEILAEFSYVLEHRAGVKHGNADGLSRQTCEDCRQCELIERRDGGSTRQELDQDEEDITSPALKAAAEVVDDNIDRLCSTAKIITRTTQSDAELAKEQATGVGPVSVIYKALRDHVEVTTEQLEQGSFELRKLHRMIDSLRINTDGVLEARLALQDKPRWCAICPLPLEAVQYGRHMH